ncbi:MAG TPA: hypothetical protein ENI30_02760 [Gammaproteobacteria bacterium]|nr:hypothetical protein [Gammaproteobacteria bacterium]
MQMRNVGIMLIACSLAGGAAAVQARELREGDKYMCSWGAGTAARAGWNVRGGDYVVSHGLCLFVYLMPVWRGALARSWTGLRRFCTGRCKALRLFARDLVAHAILIETLAYRFGFKP